MASTTLKHRYSFSGSDTKAFGYYRRSDNGGKMYHLEAMHTLSCSVFEAKGRVRSLGFKSIRGFTRAVREISGTMIMLVIDDHPLASLMKGNPYKSRRTYGGDKRSWSIDGIETALGSTSFARYGARSEDFIETDHTRIPTTLPPFNIFVSFQSEIPIGSEVRKTNSRLTGSQVAVTNPDDPLYAVYQDTYADTYRNEIKYKRGGFEIQDVEILGEGIVTSVNDMVTEIQYQFVARDYKEYSLDETRSYFAEFEKQRFEFERRRASAFHFNEYMQRAILANDGLIENLGNTMNITTVAFPRATASSAVKQLLQSKTPAEQKINSIEKTMEDLGLSNAAQQIGKEGVQIAGTNVAEQVPSDLLNQDLSKLIPPVDILNPMEVFEKYSSEGSSALQAILPHNPLAGTVASDGEEYTSYALFDKPNGDIVIVANTSSNGYSIPTGYSAATTSLSDLEQIFSFDFIKSKLEGN